MANQVPRGRGNRPKRKRQHRARRRVELVALTQTTRCGAPRKGGLRDLFRVGLLVALLLAPILFAAGTLAGTVTLDPPPDSAYWTRHSTQTGGNPQHSGFVDLDLKDADLERQWHRNGFEPILAGAVVDRENVYIVDRNGTVAALNLTTGDTAWTFDTESKVSATPALAYGWLYVATEGKTLIALSARTGTEIVRATLSGAAKAPPVIAEGRVFQGNDGGTLQVLDATTLDLLWKFDTATTTFTDGKVNQTDTTLRKPIRAAPAVYDGKVYVAAWNKRVYAFSTTGNNHGNPETWVWTRTVDDLVSAAPAVDRHRDVVLVGTASGQIEAIRLADGTQRWKLDAGGSFHRGLAVSQERVIGATSDGRLLSADPYGGALQWERIDEAGYIAAPVLTETLVVAVTANGTVHLIDDATGDPYKRDGEAVEWRLPSGSHATPAVTTRGIVAVDQSGAVTLWGPPMPRVADLSAGALVPPENLTADESLVVGISVTNRGPDPSGVVTLTWTTSDGSRGTTTIDDIASGATHTGNIVLPPLAMGPHAVEVTYSAEPSDPSPGDNSATATWTLTGSGGETSASGAPGDDSAAQKESDGAGRDEGDGLAAGFAAAWTGWMLPVALLVAAGAVAALRNRERIMAQLARLMPARGSDT